MDTLKGYQIEQPSMFIPGEISAEEFVAAFSGLDLRRINDSYFVTECISLSGMAHNLGFHFDQRPGLGVRSFEFYASDDYPNNASCFRAFQEHLEATFGEPTMIAPREEGFASYTWQREGCIILHCVQEHFGSAEYVRIEKIPPP